MDSLTHAIVGASVASVGVSLFPIDQSLMSEMLLPAMIVGFVAGLLPDLDYLFVFFRKPLLAWRYHRVALHNVFILPLLALISMPISYLCMTICDTIGLSSIDIKLFNDHLMLFYLLGVFSLISHLILDYITSFGSSFFYPFSTRRFAVGTHFLTDPVIFGLGVVGLVYGFQLLTLIIISIYILLGLTLKQLCKFNLKRFLLKSCIEYSKIDVFPKIGAPFRWLAIIENGNKYGVIGYRLFYINQIKWVEKGLDTKSYELYQLDPLINYFVSISKYPRFEDCERDGRSAISVEDIQWWFSLPKRPMAFSAIIEDGKLTDVKETNKLDTGPTGEPKSIEYINNLDL